VITKNTTVSTKPFLTDQFQLGNAYFGGSGETTGNFFIDDYRSWGL
jgi:hypothetical protein